MRHLCRTNVSFHSTVNIAIVKYKLTLTSSTLQSWNIPLNTAYFFAMRAHTHTHVWQQSLSIHKDNNMVKSKLSCQQVYDHKHLMSWTLYYPSIVLAAWQGLTVTIVIRWQFLIYYLVLQDCDGFSALPSAAISDLRATLW